MDKIKLEIELTVTDQDIDDIMVTALEGGICHWCKEAVPVGDYLGDYASDQISRGGSLMLRAANCDSTLELTKYKLLNGIKMYIQKNHNPEILDAFDGAIELDTCCIDAVVSDMIIQYALFEDIVYG